MNDCLSLGNLALEFLVNHFARYFPPQLLFCANAFVSEYADTPSAVPLAFSHIIVIPIYGFLSRPETRAPVRRHFHFGSRSYLLGIVASHI